MHVLFPLRGEKIGVCLFPRLPGAKVVGQTPCQPQSGSRIPRDPQLGLPRWGAARAQLARRGRGGPPPPRPGVLGDAGRGARRSGGFSGGPRGNLCTGVGFLGLVLGGLTRLCVCLSFLIAKTKQTNKKADQDHVSPQNRRGEICVSNKFDSLWGQYSLSMMTAHKGRGPHQTHKQAAFPFPPPKPQRLSRGLIGKEM